MLKGVKEKLFHKAELEELPKIKFWELSYGKRSRDFIEGVIAGLHTYAKVKNGKLVVGVFDEPLEKVIAEVKEQLG